MDHAVIFGGSGFIGQHLACHLVGQGIPVTIADTVPSALQHPLVRYHVVDVRRPIQLSAPAPTDAVVFNLAAVHRTPGHPDHEYYETNVLGAVNVSAWTEENQLRRMCFTSSISVYGPSETNKTESSEPQPTTAYGRSKLFAERIHGAWRDRGDDRQLVIVRPAVVFGPGERGNFTKLAGALKKGRFAYPGRDDTIKACGYVGDLVRALEFGLAQRQPELLFNFCYPKHYDIKEICEAFNSVAGYELPKMVPRQLVETGLRVLRVVSRGDDRGATFAPSRIAKLTISNRIEPAVLRSAGFSWPTDLPGALHDWFDATPRGRFT